MGLFSIFQRNKEAEALPQVHRWDASDRAFSAEIRAKKREITLMEMQKEHEITKMRLDREQLLLQRDIQELQGEDEDAPSSNTSDDLLKMVLPLIIGNAQLQKNPASGSAGFPPLPTEQKQVFSTAQIQEIWNSLPRFAQKKAKELDDATLGALIRSKLPNIAEQSIAEAVGFIKNS